VLVKRSLSATGALRGPLPARVSRLISHAEGPTCPATLNTVMPYDLSVPGWMKEYDLQVVEKLAQRIPRDGSMIEIGSFMGRSSVAWAMSAHPSVSIKCIDLWGAQGYFENREWGELTDCPDGDLSVYTGSYQDTFRDMTKRFPNVRGIQGNSRDDYDISDLDLVFLDGDHHFTGVKADLANWSKRLKPDGLLCGHDFAPAPRFKGVVHAVMGHSFHHNLHIFCPAHSRIWMLFCDGEHQRRWWPD
jgi:SAM-dependent methyltransferase